MNDLEQFVYNNEEEAEMAQLHSLHINANAIAAVQARLARQAKQESLEECEECGEEIPLARRQAIPGVTMCVDCKQRQEKGLTFGT